MVHRKPAISLLLLYATASHSSAFVAPAAAQKYHHGASLIKQQPTLFLSSTTTASSWSDTAIISGAPSSAALTINPINALSQSTVFHLDGSPILLSNFINTNDDKDGVSLIVLTRSFG